MSNQERDATLRAAVLEWQKKYGVQDGDPLLASLELFQIYLGSLHAGSEDNGVSPPSFGEFRASIELLNSRSKAVAKHAAELIEALRAIPNLKRQLAAYRITALLLIALCSLAAGVCLGRFFL